MRIISGNKKSIVINAPKNLPVRPTTDKVKESLFNIIQNKFELNYCSVLDIFSGTGNISYEFASRGCNDILSVDNNFNCIRFINKTAKELEIKIRTKKIDYLSFLKNNNEKFNIIFADPPYRFLLKDYLEMIDIVRKNEILKESGELIIEHRSNISFIDNVKEVDERNYGSSSLSFFKKASL
jgi:16S rRNA (guanine966-N2)-methyltransferase|tara:strand:- start:182 stop:727 length:546 start_codon:yes stop_codon:yes gene_type:complete